MQPTYSEHQQMQPAADVPGEKAVVMHLPPAPPNAPVPDCAACANEASAMKQATGSKLGLS